MGRTAQWHQLHGSPILVTENVCEYRACISEHVQPGDVAIEVGCAEGVTTALIARHAARAVGIDKSASQVAKAQARHQAGAHPSNLSFHLIEAWDLNSVLKLAAAEGWPPFSVVFIDVSGSRRVGDVDNLIMKYEQVFQPRLFIVKSYQLKRLINRCQLFFCQSNHQRQLPSLAAGAAATGGSGAQPQAAAAAAAGSGWQEAPPTPTTAAAAAADTSQHSRADGGGGSQPHCEQQQCAADKLAPLPPQQQQEQHQQRQQVEHTAVAHSMAPPPQHTAGCCVQL